MQKEKMLDWIRRHQLVLKGALALLSVLLLVVSYYISRNRPSEAQAPGFIVYEASYEVETTRDTKVWPKGTKLSEDTTDYFYATDPILSVQPQLRLQGEGFQDIKGELTGTLRVENREEGRSSYWKYPLTKPVNVDFVLENLEATFNAPAQPISLTAVRNQIREIEEELDFSNGSYRIVYEADVSFEGTYKGEAVSRSEKFEVPFIMESSFFTGPTESDSLYRLNLSNTPVAESGKPSMWEWLGNYWLLIAISVASIIWFALEAYKKAEKLEQNRSEHKRFKEWITEGRVNAVDKTQISVYSLEGLVDLAIDLEKRVLFDPEQEKYFVLEDSFAYVFSPKAQHQAISKNLTRLGDLLLDAKLITLQELELGLNYREVHGGLLGQSLMALGLLDETSLYSTLAEQSGMTFYSMDPNRKEVNLEWLGGMTIAECIQSEMVPLFKRGDRIVVASGNVVNMTTWEKMEDKFGFPLLFVMSQASKIRQLIDRYQVKMHEIEENDKEKVRSSKAERLQEFQQSYRKNELNITDFLLLSELVAAQDMLDIPNNQSLIRWFVRQNLIQEETGHLITALCVTAERMSPVRAEQLMLPEKAEVLARGGYLSKDALKDYYKRMQEDPNFDRKSMLEELLVSDKTIELLEELMVKLQLLLKA